MMEVQQQHETPQLNETQTGPMGQSTNTAKAPRPPGQGLAKEKRRKYYERMIKKKSEPYMYIKPTRENYLYKVSYLQPTKTKEERDWEFKMKMVRLKASIPLKSLITSITEADQLFTIEHLRSFISNYKDISANCLFLHFIHPEDTTVRVIECQLYFFNILIATVRSRIARGTMQDLHESTFMRGKCCRDMLNEVFLRGYNYIQYEDPDIICQTHRVLVEDYYPRWTFSEIVYGMGKAGNSNMAHILRNLHPHKAFLKRSASEFIFLESPTTVASKNDNFTNLMSSASYCGVHMSVKYTLYQSGQNNKTTCSIFLDDVPLADGMDKTRDGARIKAAEIAVKKVKKNYPIIVMYPNKHTDMRSWDVMCTQAEAWFSAYGSEAKLTELEDELEREKNNFIKLQEYEYNQTSVYADLRDQELDGNQMYDDQMDCEEDCIEENQDNAMATDKDTGHNKDQRSNSKFPSIYQSFQKAEVQVKPKEVSPTERVVTVSKPSTLPNTESPANYGSTLPNPSTNTESLANYGYGTTSEFYNSSWTPPIPPPAYSVILPPPPPPPPPPPCEAPGSSQQYWFHNGEYYSFDEYGYCYKATGKESSTLTDATESWPTNKPSVNTMSYPVQSNTWTTSQTSSMLSPAYMAAPAVPSYQWPSTGQSVVTSASFKGMASELVGNSVSQSLGQSSIDTAIRAVSQQISQTVNKQNSLANQLSSKSKTGKTQWKVVQNGKFLTDLPKPEDTGKFEHTEEPILPLNKKVILYVFHLMKEHDLQENLDKLDLCYDMPLAERQALEILSAQYNFRLFYLVKHGQQMVSLTRLLSSQEMIAILRRSNNTRGRVVLIKDH